jgi:hypothetical protein
VFTQQGTTRTSLFSTFVSKHNRIDGDVVRRFLEDLPDVEIMETTEHFKIRDCKSLPEGLCLKPNGTDKPDNQWKVYIMNGKGGSGGAGTYFCHRCGAKGSWYDLKKLSHNRNKLENNEEFEYNISRGFEPAVKWDRKTDRGVHENLRAKPMLRCHHPDIRGQSQFHIKVSNTKLK